MFDRPHHQKVASVLNTFDEELLGVSECYFGGGTAIVLSLGEYRESVDIDFLCSSRDGFRLLRNVVTSQSLGALLKADVRHLREVRCERDKISTFLSVESVPIKVEFIFEGNIDISGEMSQDLGVPVLSRCDMYATKLLANADRGLDRSTLSRDAIDLAMMIRGWGPIPALAWEKARDCYGDAVLRGFNQALHLIQDRSYLLSCLHKMKMDPALAQLIPQILNNEHSFQLRKQGGSMSSGPT
ncbi:hypothetical protein CL689_06260 [Candidatus Saccharibacteria bacterium]|nr:hypothetical protein [Candidatus Saccharibacteria bacterium]